MFFLFCLFCLLALANMSANPFSVSRCSSVCWPCHVWFDLVNLHKLLFGLSRARTRDTVFWGVTLLFLEFPKYWFEAENQGNILSITFPQTFTFHAESISTIANGLFLMETMIIIINKRCGSASESTELVYTLRHRTVITGLAGLCRNVSN